MVTPNEQPVKRGYESPARAAQARETRRRIVAAAGSLFVERGYGGTTVDDIAGAAGVSRKTVFASVGSKLEALKLACDWAIVGDDEPVPLLDRPQTKGDGDARQVLAGFAALVNDIGARFAPLAHVVDSAAGTDEGLRELAQTGTQQRLTGTRVLAGVLQRTGQLRVPPDVAVDILWLHNDPAMYYKLVIERGWSRKHHREWLHENLCAQLLK